VSQKFSWICSVVAMLMIAFILAGCVEDMQKRADNASAEVNKQLPPGCRFVFLGDYDRVGKVSYVYCRDRTVTTTNLEWSTGKSSTTAVVVDFN